MFSDWLPFFPGRVLEVDSMYMLHVHFCPQPHVEFQDSLPTLDNSISLVTTFSYKLVHNDHIAPVLNETPSIL